MTRMTFACVVYSKFPPSLHAPWLAPTLLRCHFTNTSFTPLIPQPVSPPDSAPNRALPPPRFASQRLRAAPPSRNRANKGNVHSRQRIIPIPISLLAPALTRRPNTLPNPTPTPTSGPFAPLVSEPGHPAHPLFPARSLP
jgi:hypothetical protein